MHVVLRSILLLVPLLAPLLLTAQQTSVYATANITLFSPVNNGNLLYSTDKFGFVAGGVYNFLIASRFKPEVDLRVVESPNGAGGTALLGAIRGSFVPVRVPLRPYIQIGGGVISARNQYFGASSGTRLTGGGWKWISVWISA